MNIHFIAIGGAVMHNLALSLRKQGHKVTGSDDEIFEPALSNLAKAGILPSRLGWHPDAITSDIDEIILGMHAKADNPELLKAQQLNLKIYSFPEYVFEQTKNKKRVVIGGSHGKTTVTAMIMHVLKSLSFSFDYLVGAQLEHFDLMVNFEPNNQVAIIEGDEYLASAMQPIPKFLFYHPHIAVLTGIAWDHINVFPTFENYVAQFENFLTTIVNNGALIYSESDKVLSEVVQNAAPASYSSIPYDLPGYIIQNEKVFITYQNSSYPLSIFGKHNLLNLNAAWNVCRQLAISDEMFLKSMASFKGAAKRLQLLKESEQLTVIKDFAHSPSKVKASISAVKEFYATKQIVAILELHTFSSLNSKFLNEYAHTMDEADLAIVFYSAHSIALKGMKMMEKDLIAAAFGLKHLQVFHDTAQLSEFIAAHMKHPAVLLFMSSGNFDGLDLTSF